MNRFFAHLSKWTALRLTQFAVCAAICCLITSCNLPNAQRQQSVYDRVLGSGTMRASYAIYPPYSVKDPNTGRLSGIFVDTLNEAGKRLNLRVSWTEEVGFGSVFESLNSNRTDVFGAGIWRNATRGKVGDFSRPLFYNVIKVYGRPDELQRFSDPASLESPTVRISVQDGAIEDLIAKSDFPNAKRVSIPQLTPWSNVLLNITTGKADITFAEPAVINLFLKQNPGALVELQPSRPLRVFANTYAFKLDEPAFKSMLDSALEEMQNDGTTDRIVKKYENQPGEYLRVAPPYVIPPSGQHGT